MSQIYLEKCNICFIPFIALKRNILENSDFVLLKEDIHRFISSIELFLRDIRGLRYADLKKVNFFAGHPVVKLYQLNKPWTSFDFHTIKIRLAMVDILPTHILASHSILGRLGGGCLGSYLGCMK